ncbi:YnfU family zinc-binding protein [Dryocola sp. BD626]|jgi:transposase|uniref:YnfU family zinc-binding protein n=1 Tax=Dryocola sp. BD626 TaxID=3133273 RepID=UPI003F4FB84C
MSFFADAMNRINDKSTTTVTCPQCGNKSKQPSSKIQRGQAMLCPGCKALFVITR